MHWFEVDREGLAKILARRGKEFLLYELIQNAWDQKVTQVEVVLERVPRSRMAVVRVSDDDPDGFRSLEDSWTLFAESGKKADAGKRGRFNLGEKLVLAMCETAEITSTTGGVRFDGDGRHRLRRRRDRGTVFEATIRMTDEVMAHCAQAIGRLIPPANISTTFNGAPLIVRTPLAEFTAVLRTEMADAEGSMRPTSRKTTVRVFAPLPGEVASIYEMGIPVVETEDAWHVDVQQKVPLGMDRDNVPPGWLRALRTLVLNVMHDRLPDAAATSVWVRDALGSQDVTPEAVRSVVEQRFGTKSVVYDPTDPEANKIAVSRGFTVVHGSQLSAAEWSNVRAAGILPRAGLVTPSPKPFSPDGEPLRTLQEDEWSPSEAAMAARYRRMAKAIIGEDIHVTMGDDASWPFLAAYGRSGCRLTLNRRRLGRVFFEMGASERAIDLLIHELGHHYSNDHLSSEYYDALTSLGAKLVLAVARDPELLA